MPSKAKTRTFTVNMAVNCRVAVTVEAGSAEEAFAAAEDAFMDTDLGDVDDIVDARPVNAVDNETGELTDN